jgi:hypothetical protein
VRGDGLLEPRLRCGYILGVALFSQFDEPPMFCRVVGLCRRYLVLRSLDFRCRLLGSRARATQCRIDVPFSGIDFALQGGEPCNNFFFLLDCGCESGTCGK